MALGLDCVRQTLLVRKAELKQQSEATEADWLSVELDQTSAAHPSGIDAMQTRVMASRTTAGAPGRDCGHKSRIPPDRKR